MVGAYRFLTHQVRQFVFERVHFISQGLAVLDRLHLVQSRRQDVESLLLRDCFLHVLLQFSLDDVLLLLNIECPLKLY